MVAPRVSLLAAAAALGVAAGACSASPTRPTDRSSTALASEAPSSAGGPSTLGAQSPSIVLRFPGESPGPPFFAISGNGGFIPHDGQWAAIPFHRQLACVPAAQNLLVVAIPAAFGCTLTVQGHEHWEHGPGIDLAPRQTQALGLGAVPIVFVRWSEVQGALGGGLTLPELLALPSAIVGTADFYKETDILGISGPHGAGRGSYKINASGSFADATTFRLHVNEVLGELRVVEIAFGG
jgi:hypothetical protein